MKEPKETTTVPEESTGDSFDDVDVTDEDVKALEDDEGQSTKETSKTDSDDDDDPDGDQDSDKEDPDEDDGEKNEHPDDDGDGDDGGEKDEKGDEPSDGDDADKPELYEVDGEKLTLEELKRGYLRTKDYTQKTQELAEKRKSIEGILKILSVVKDGDPEVKEALKDYWVEKGNKAEDFDAALNADPGENPYKEEYEGKLQQAQSELSRLKTEMEVAREIDEIKSKFKVTDKELDEIFDFATRHEEKTGKLLSLEEAYKLMNFDKIREESKRLAPPKTPKNLGRGARETKSKPKQPKSFEDIEVTEDDLFSED
jgi:hypothetical protein